MKKTFVEQFYTAKHNNFRIYCSGELLPYKYIGMLCNIADNNVSHENTVAVLRYDDDILNVLCEIIDKHDNFLEYDINKQIEILASNGIVVVTENIGLL